LNPATLFQLLLVAALIGHFGLWIWLYNRINATGLPRATIKRIEKILVLVCIALPGLILAMEWSRGNGGEHWDRLSLATLIYSAFVLVFLVVVGPIWVAHRPIFSIAKSRYQLADQHRRHRLHRENPEWVQGAKTRRCLRLPGNEILSLETNVKRVRLDGLKKSLLGLRIGHLSDIHLTGELTTDFPRHCVDWVLSQGIDLLVVSGDLVDDPSAVPMLDEVFGGLPADLPRVFVLGNHDKAHDLVQPVCERMAALGWSDVGAHDEVFAISQSRVLVRGNELPWLERHALNLESHPPNSEPPRAEEFDLVLGVAHSPDQFAWGCRIGCQLLLCGHTHGGQIRFPGIGPIVAPSWYGSRYASGVFYRSPTVMHVSRGLSGAHPLRWRCPPEASVIVLVESLASPLSPPGKGIQSSESVGFHHPEDTA
jgi:uncharacterized protein